MGEVPKGMKLTNALSPELSPATTTAAAQAGSKETVRSEVASAAAAGAASGGDRIQVAVGSQLTALALGAVTAERANRIEQLKRDVRSGTYRVNTSELSRALVLEFLSLGIDPNEF
jgi:anti-sigma28 factor (negative regulator of flagellin synthesis)